MAFQMQSRNLLSCKIKKTEDKTLLIQIRKKNLCRHHFKSYQIDLVGINSKMQNVNANNYKFQNFN